MGDTLRAERMYSVITSQLREHILGGKYRPSEKLPPERELAEKFAVSRVTIRRVLAILQEERLVYRRQGSGTYASPNPTRRIPIMIDYTGSVRDHAPTMRRRLILWKWMPAEEWAADLLEIEAGERILYAERTDETRGVIVAYDRAYIALAFAEGLMEKQLTRVDFIETWAKTSRFQLELCRQTVEAEAAPSAVAKALHMKPRAPVLKSTEIYLTHEDRPVGFFISYYHPAHICVSSKFRWDRGHE